jgi:hypothetical protein
VGYVVHVLVKKNMYTIHLCVCCRSLNEKKEKNLSSSSNSNNVKRKSAEEKSMLQITRRVMEMRNKKNEGEKL